MGNLEDLRNERIPGWQTLISLKHWLCQEGDSYRQFLGQLLYYKNLLCADSSSGCFAQSAFPGLPVSSLNKPLSHALSPGHFFAIPRPSSILGLEFARVQLHRNSPCYLSPAVWQHTGFLSAAAAATSLLEKMESKCGCPLVGVVAEVIHFSPVGP